MTEESRAPLVDRIAWLLSEHYSSRPGCACASQGSVEYSEHVARLITGLMNQYPQDYTDRQLLESVYRRIDGLALMLAGPTRTFPDAHQDDIADAIAAWEPKK